MLPSHFSVVDLGVFALAIVVGLLVLLLYLFDFGSKKGSSLPGVSPSDPVKGNIDDIGKAGSLHQYLMKLHKEFGPIASFWWADLQVVSVASPSTFKDVQGIFDRPAPLFKMFEPLITKHSIQYANGADGRKRHKLITGSFGHEAMSRYYDIFTKIGEDKKKEWESCSPEDQVLLQDVGFSMASQAIMQSSLGPILTKNESEEFVDSYHTCWDELERRLVEGEPYGGSEFDIKFKKANEKCQRMLKLFIQKRRKAKPEVDEINVIDKMISEGYPEEQLYAELLSTLIGGLHTSANLINWSIYFMSKHPEVQERVYEELKDVLDEETVTPQVLGQLKYLKQVLDETLRCAAVAPMAARWNTEYDTQIGEYKVPKKTPIIIALGVVLQDPEIWPEPQRFDPERFNPEEMKKMDALAFEPFGFAGKRKCPGYRFSYVEATVFLSILMRRFKFHLAEDIDVGHVYGLITRPDRDIYITVSKRE